VSASFGNFLNWYNVRTYGATGDGTTDDTVAINAAIAACGTAGGGTVYFPAGVYLCDGAFNSNGVSSPILTLPQVAMTDQAITIVFQGAAPPPRQYFTFTSTFTAGYSIIKTTRTGGSSGCCLLGGPAPTYLSFGNQNNVSPVLRNLIFACPTTPTFTAVDFKYQQGNRVDDVLIYAGTTDLDGLTQPTSSFSYGLTLPEVNHSASNWVNGVNVFGFYNGTRLGENTSGAGLRAWGCVNGICAPNYFHFSAFNDIGTYWCTNHLVGEGGSGGEGRSPIRIFVWDIEQANGGGASWQNTVANVLDSSNRLSGDVTYIPIKGSVGYDNSSFVKTGGSLLTCTPFGGP